VIWPSNKIIKLKFYLKLKKGVLDALFYLECLKACRLNGFMNQCPKLFFQKLIPLLCLSFIFLISFLVPLSWIQSIPLCTFQFFTGFDCPGCGLTRAFWNISHGHFLRALSLNGSSWVLYLLFVFAFLRQIFIILGKEAQWLTPTLFKNKVIYWGFGFLFFGQWLLKLAHQINV